MIILGSYGDDAVDREPARFSRIAAAGLALLAVTVSPAAPLAAPGPVRVTTQSVGAATGGKSTPTPRNTSAVRDLLAPHLSAADLRAVMASAATVSRVTRLLDVMASGPGRDQFLAVDVVPVPGGGRTVYVSLRQRGTLDRSEADRSYRQESATTVGEVAILLRPVELPPPPAPTIAMPAPRPAPDALPTGSAPCSSGDAACWRHDTMRELFDHPPSCEAYLEEQDRHVKRLALDFDVNGRAVPSAIPDPTAPERDRQLRAREWAGAYPTGEIDSGFDEFATRPIRLTNGAPCAAPRPARPSDECSAEWAERSVSAVPTLACTREIVDHEHWRVGDALVRAAEAPFSPIASLPIVSQILAAKARRVADDTSWRGVFAVRWIERLADARARGDDAYQDRAAANLAGTPEERRILAANLRRWLASAVNAPWHDTIRAFYEERFTALYPQAVDACGMPLLEGFPTRLWWATNWLAAAQRRGLAPEAAAEMLRCAPDNGQAIAVLKDLAPHLSTDPRFASIVVPLVALL